MVVSGIELGETVPPDEPAAGPSALSGRTPPPCGDGLLCPDDPPGAAPTNEMVEPGEAPPAGPAPLNWAALPALLAPAPATAARRAAEAPLAAGVDAGNLNGVIVPWAAPRTGPDALEPPRGGRAAPPPGPLAGCHGVEMP